MSGTPGIKKAARGVSYAAYVLVWRARLAAGPLDEPAQYPTDGVYVQRLRLGRQHERRDAPARLEAMLV
jgi:hypothetical protein